MVQVFDNIAQQPGQGDDRKRRRVMTTGSIGIKAKKSNLEIRDKPQPLIHSLLRPVQLFADQPPAWFCPGVPDMLRHRWQAHGGQIIPHLPVTLHLKSSSGKAILDELSRLIAEQQGTPCLAFFEHTVDNAWLYAEQKRGGGRTVQPVDCRLIDAAILTEDADMLDESPERLRVAGREEGVGQVEEDLHDEAEIDNLLRIDHDGAKGASARPVRRPSESWDPSPAVQTPYTAQNTNGDRSSSLGPRVDIIGKEVGVRVNHLILKTDDLARIAGGPWQESEIQRIHGDKSPRQMADHRSPARNRFLPTLPVSPAEYVSSSPYVTDTWTHATGSQPQTSTDRDSHRETQYKLQFSQPRYPSAPVPLPDTPTPKSRSSSDRPADLRYLHNQDRPIVPFSRSCSWSSPMATSRPAPLLASSATDNSATMGDKKVMLHVDIPSHLLRPDMSAKEIRDICDVFMQDSLENLNDRAAQTPFSMEPPASSPFVWTASSSSSAANSISSPRCQNGRDNEAMIRLQAKRDEALRTVMGSRPVVSDPRVAPSRPNRSEAAVASRRPLRPIPATTESDEVGRLSVQASARHLLATPQPDPGRRGVSRAHNPSRSRRLADSNAQSAGEEGSEGTDTEVDSPGNDDTQISEIQSPKSNNLTSLSSARSISGLSTPIPAFPPTAASSAPSSVDSPGSSYWRKRIPPSGKVSSTETSTDLGYFPSTESTPSERSRYRLRERVTRKKPYDRESISKIVKKEKLGEQEEEALQPGCDWRGRAARDEDARLMAAHMREELGLFNQQLAEEGRTRNRGMLGERTGRRVKRDGSS